jgi:hypothetical protein
LTEGSGSPLVLSVTVPAICPVWAWTADGSAKERRTKSRETQGKWRIRTEVGLEDVL